MTYLELQFVMPPPQQPYLANPILRFSYSLIAPVYDAVIERPMQKARKQSLHSLPIEGSRRVLISGVGTGLDLPWLPGLHRYSALDFNSAMLARARTRGKHLDIDFVLGDSMSLPFADEQFDHVVLHLIVAVVPDSDRCLSEAARVLKSGGTIILFDKFLQPNRRAPIRRLLSGITRFFATRMDVVLEEVLRASPELEVVCNVPLLANGWFRGLVLRKSIL